MDNDGDRILRGLKFTKKLGAGGTASAFEYQRDPSVVIKQTDWDSRISHEGEILGHILPPHKGVIYLLDYEPVNKPSNRPERFLLEFCDGGDLTQIMQRHQDYLPEAFIWHVFLRLAETLAYMHRGWNAEHQRATKPWNTVIVHRDLKPQNVFLKHRFNAYPEIIIADFGHAKNASADNYNPYGGGTPEFEPPERPLMTEKADIWALGAILQALIQNPRVSYPIRQGFRERAAAETYAEIRYLHSPREEDDHWYSRRLYFWMAKCLSYDPHDRPTAMELAMEMVPEARIYRDTHFEAL